MIEETKQIARELRSKFYGKNGELLQPGVLELLKKELGPGGQNWFNVNHSELAQYAQTLKRNYLNQMKTVMGERPTDKDTETYLGTLFDWALSPTANAANLEAKANEMKQRLMANIAMRKHALKTGGDMSTFDPQTVPSGNIEILDE
ncbi:hypothetical protein EBZ39_08395 [bacterium]|nr:hypothetical protein [bacterium]